LPHWDVAKVARQGSSGRVGLYDRAYLRATRPAPDTGRLLHPRKTKATEEYNQIIAARNNA